MPHLFPPHFRLFGVHSVLPTKALYVTDLWFYPRVFVSSLMSDAGKAGSLW